MSESDRSVLQKKTEYRNAFLLQEMVLVYGSDFNSKGGYGIGVVDAANEQDAIHRIVNDLAAAINFFEYHPMRALLPC